MPNLHKLNPMLSNIHNIDHKEALAVIEALLKDKQYEELNKIFDLPTLDQMNYELFTKNAGIELSENLHTELLRLHRMFYANKYKTIDEMIYGKEAADHIQSVSAISQCDDSAATATIPKHLRSKECLARRVRYKPSGIRRFYSACASKRCR